jgi:hypothetical protein
VGRNSGSSSTRVGRSSIGSRNRSLRRTPARHSARRHNKRSSCSARFLGLPAGVKIVFPRENHPFRCIRSKPSQGSAPAGLTRAILGFVSNARWVLAQCCVDPWRSPCFSGSSSDLDPCCRRSRGDATVFKTRQLFERGKIPLRWPANCFLPRPMEHNAGTDQ